MTALEATALIRDPDAVKRPSRRRRFRWIRDNRTVTTLTAICLALYLCISLTEYDQYATHGFDLGIFDQAVRSYAHFRAPVSAIKGPGFNLLGDHFSPVIALFAPLYWIWDNPVMLLIAQAMLVASSVPIVHRIAKRRLPPAPALLVTAAYGLGWPIQAMLNFDVHETAFAVPILAAALDAAEQRRYTRVLLWSAAMVFVKEDMGFVLVAFGVVLAVRGRADDEPLRARLLRPLPAALVVAIGGVLAYLVTTKAIIPSFAPGGGYVYWQYGAIGKDLPDALANLVTSPWHGLTVFFSPWEKTFTLALLCLPFGLIPLRSPYALMAVPLLAERFFNERDQLWIPVYHYNALPWLVLTIAFIDGAARLDLFGPARWWTRKVVAGWLVFFEVITVWMAMDYVQQMSPGAGFVQRLADWNNSAVLNREAALRSIPSGACVEASNRLAPHLTARDYVTLPGAPGIRPDFVVLDRTSEFVGPSQVSTPGAVGVRSLLELRRARAAGYRAVGTYGNIIVLRSPNYAGPTAACAPMGSGNPTGN